MAIVKVSNAKLISEVLVAQGHESEVVVTPGYQAIRTSASPADVRAAEMVVLRGQVAELNAAFATQIAADPKLAHIVERVVGVRFVKAVQS